MGFSVKIKAGSTGGQHIISNLSEETKLSELKEKIKDVLKSSSDLEVRRGFPPRLLQSSDEETLKSCGISSGGK